MGYAQRMLPATHGVRTLGYLPNHRPVAGSQMNRFHGSPAASEQDAGIEACRKRCCPEVFSPAQGSQCTRPGCQAGKQRCI